MTLDDVSCLLHLHTNGTLLSNETITQDNAVDSMVQQLRSDPGDALLKVTRTKGANCRFSYLRSTRIEMRWI